jgi:hypothetical protein
MALVLAMVLVAVSAMGCAIHHDEDVCSGQRVRQKGDVDAF